MSLITTKGNFDGETLSKALDRGMDKETLNRALLSLISISEASAAAVILLNKPKKSIAIFQECAINSYKIDFDDLDMEAELLQEIAEKLPENYSSDFSSYHIKQELLEGHNLFLFPLKTQGKIKPVIVLAGKKGIKLKNADTEFAVLSILDFINTKLQIETLYHNVLNEISHHVNNIDDGLWILDLESRTVSINIKAEELLGYEHGELNKGMDEVREKLFTEQTFDTAEKIATAAKRNERELVYDTSLKQSNGDYIWVHGKVKIFYRENVPHAIMGTIHDISGIKSMEISLERSKGYYQDILDNLGEVVFNTDAEGKIIYLNRSWKRLTGYDVNECINTDISDYFFDPNTKNNRIPKFNRVEKKGIEVLIKTKTGNALWVHLTVRDNYLYANNIKGYIGSVFNIHESKLANLKIIENEQTFRFITENSNDIISLETINGKLIYISPSLRTITGYDDEYIKDHLDDMSPLTDAMKSELKKDGKKSISLTHEITRKDGKNVWLESVYNCFYSPLEDDFVILSTSRDVSVRKKAEEEMARALEKEKELNKLKTDFIDMATHEFKSPLTSIKSSVQLLDMNLRSLKEKALKETFGRHLDRVNTQVNRMNRLMDQIFAIGKIEKGTVTINPVKTDLEAFIKDLINDVKQFVDDERDIELSIKGTKKDVEIDNFLLYHILFNLLSNAMKYSKGGANPKISIDFLKKSIIFAVKDFGIGIPEEEQKNLFQSFFRANNALTIPGTGLGLVIVKNFTQLLDGSLDIQSKLNAGTLIKVTIPEK